MTFDTTHSHQISPVSVDYEAAFGVSLGKDANKLSTFPVSIKNNRSVARLKLLDTARSILARHDVRSAQTGNRHRTRNCHAVQAYKKDIYITLNSSTDASSAGLSGLQTCGSICSCPMCATNKMVDYGQDIRKALAYADWVNLRPVMLTLTARHTKDMSLKFFKDAFRNAYNTFQRHRKFRDIKKSLDIQHQITSREITHGKHGWHYHMHILFFVPVSSIKHAQDATPEVLSLTATWLRSLELNGLDATEENGLDLSSGKSNKTYLAKLGYEVAADGDLAFELTGNENKGKTVFDLLAMAHYGDIGAEALYVEYVNEMQGHKWITFSDGFKELFKDIELEQKPIPDNQKLHNWFYVDARTWYAVARLNKVSQIVKFAAKYRCKERLRCLLQTLSDEWYYGQ